ncbi:MAG: CinA family protein [Sulfurimonas sp.]|nr:CinA family protein [Sulfurimonas sp.]
MKLHLIFIGNKFIYNTSLKEYVIRNIEQKSDFIDSVTYFKESDNSLFLYLEQELNSSDKLIVVTSKYHFSTIGKLICTATSDNQILKDGMLIPSKVSVFEEGSYLLEHNNSITNVLHVDEMQKLPEILLHFEESNATIHIFEEDKESAIAILSPIAQTHEVNIDIVTLIDGWLRVDVRSKKYGNISKFITSSKQLLPNKLIGVACIVTYITDRLAAKNKKISFAESCTGGLLTYFFTRRNGASKILDGSLVTYSNIIKENWLGVNNETLKKYGAVSNEVVLEMSEGVMNVSNADYAISVSGVAGDGGGTEYKPVGTIHVGVRTEEEHKEVRLNLSGDRNYIQYQSTLFAIKILILIDKEMFF